MAHDRVDYLKQMIVASREAFTRQGRDTGYIFSRGLTRSIGTEQTYENYLPTFEQKTLTQVLQEKIQQVHSPQEVTYLDIGYGNGLALLEAKQRYGDVIAPIGYGTTYHSKVPYKDLDGIVYSPTYDELITQNIKLIEGNVLDIRQMVPDNSIDVVSALHSIDYAQLPYWEVMKKIYRILKPGGIAFISNIYITNRNELQNYLQAQGYEFEVREDALSFRKTKSELPVEIRTVTGENDEFQRIEILSERKR